MVPSTSYLAAMDESSGRWSAAGMHGLHHWSSRQDESSGQWSAPGMRSLVRSLMGDGTRCQRERVERGAAGAQQAGGET